MEVLQAQTLKGDLEFINLFNPIKLYVFRDEIEWINLWDHLHKVLQSLNGSRISVDDKLTHFEIKRDLDSENKFKYNNDGQCILMISEGVTSLSNIGYYLPHALERFNGRKVIINLTADSFKIEPDPEHPVPEVYYTHNNACLLDSNHVKDICKPATHDTCIFLTLGKEGFFCEKFGSSGSVLLHRFNEGNMNASRIGNCAIVGRKDAPKPKISLDQYPDLQKLVANKAKYIGWKLSDAGDAMDRRLFGDNGMTTTVTDIIFELEDSGTSASLKIKGKDFDCGVNVEYGSVRKFTDDDVAIHFYGYMGHSFAITKE